MQYNDTLFCQLLKGSNAYRQTFDGVFTHTGGVALWSLAWLVYYFGPELNISTSNGLIVAIFCTKIQGSQTMKPNDFGDRLTFPLLPS